MRGVIDSEDLPLNVSREILQKDATTRFIRKQVVSKTLTLLEELSTNKRIRIHRRVAESLDEAGAPPDLLKQRKGSRTAQWLARYLREPSTGGRPAR